MTISQKAVSGPMSDKPTCEEVTQPRIYTRS
jgi:hypothetical protein